MKTEVKIINPFTAQEMLKRNNGNRSLSPTHVANLANQMRRGQWIFDGQQYETCGI